MVVMAVLSNYYPETCLPSSWMVSASGMPKGLHRGKAFFGQTIKIDL